MRNGWPASASPKLGANLGRSDEFVSRVGQSARRERFVRGQQQARDFAPRLSFERAAPLGGAAGVGGPFEAFSISNCRFDQVNERAG
jgi:hypothetical protein